MLGYGTHLNKRWKIRRSVLYETKRYLNSADIYGIKDSMRLIETKYCVFWEISADNIIKLIKPKPLAPI